MSAHDVCRPEGGPLERNHLKDMVQRNSLESVALTKLSKNLETERKAFVRQSTRDEDEMKHLLQRLQIKQQSTLPEDWTDSDEETLEGEDDDDHVDIVINPYPITIVPKFGASGANTKLSSSPGRQGNQCKQTRRRSDECDDGHDSMSMMTSSVASISDHMSNFDDVTAEWLASPNAISSVRRLRKTVPEQIQRKIMIRTNSDMSWGSDVSSSPSSPMSHSRSNSLKERNKSISSTIGEAGLQRAAGRVGRRGTSLKERKTSHVTDESDQKKLLRSYSMITKTSVRDGTFRSDNPRYLKRNRKLSTGESGSDVKLNMAPGDACQSDQNRPIIRKNSKKVEKAPLERKTSY